MRMIHAHSLLLVVLVQTLAVSVKCQSIADTAECLHLVLPQVQEFLEWERILSTACRDGPRTVAGNLVEELSESVPEALDDFGHGSSSMYEELHTGEEHHTRSDEYIVKTTRVSTETGDEQHRMKMDEDEVSAPSQSCTNGKCKERERKMVNSGKRADEAEHNNDQDVPLAEQVHSIQSSFKPYKDKVQLAMSSSIDSLLQNIDVPPADLSLWTSQHYISVAVLLSSSILISLGSISVGKRLFKKSLTRRDESSTTNEYQADPSEHAPESDSSPENKDTPPSSNDQDSPEDSPPPEREQYPTRHTPRSRNEQNDTHQTQAPANKQRSTENVPPTAFGFFMSTPSSVGQRKSSGPTQVPKDTSTEHEMTKMKEHDLVSSSGYRSTFKSVSAQESVNVQEENFDREDNSSYVLVGKAVTSRDGPAPHTTEGHNENGEETAKSFGGSDVDFRVPLSLESKGQQQSDIRPFPRVLDQSRDETRWKTQASAVSGNPILGHWSDLSDTKSQSPSMKQVDYKLSERHAETGVTVSRDQQLDNISQEQRSKTTSRVTFKDDKSHSSRDDEYMTDNKVAPDGEKGGKGAEQATRDTRYDEERTGVQANSTYDVSQVQSSVSPQSSEDDVADNSTNMLESLDTTLASQRTEELNDDLTTREAQRTERSQSLRSRAEQAYTSPTRRPNSPRSPTASWNRNRWSSPPGRREVVQPQHFPDSCPICRKNARLIADTAKEESESRTSASSKVTTTDSQQQVESSTSSFSAAAAAVTAEGKEEEEDEEEESKEGKRHSFRRTLSQVLSSSRSKSTTSLSSGSSSKKIDKVRSKFHIS